MLFERKDIKKIIEISERIADGNESLSAQDVISLLTHFIQASSLVLRRRWQKLPTPSTHSQSVSSLN